MQVGFGSGSVWAVLQQFTDGTTPSNSTIAKLGVVQEWSMDIQWDMKSLYGTYDSPLMVARGKAKYPLKMKFAEFNANLFEAVVFGALSQPATGATLMGEDESHSIPTTPYQVTVAPPASGVFVADWGVRFAATGLVLTKVASAPTTGQYSVSGAVYTFAAADTGLGVLISYEYTIAGGYTITVNRQLLGSLPVFKFMGRILTPLNQNSTAQFVVKFNQVVAGKLSIGTKLDDFTMPEIDAEAFADSSGKVFQMSMAEL